MVDSAVTPILGDVGLALGMTGVLIYIEVIKKMTVVAFLRAIGVQLVGRQKSTMNLVKESQKT